MLRILLPAAAMVLAFSVQMSAAADHDAELELREREWRQQHSHPPEEAGLSCLCLQVCALRGGTLRQLRYPPGCGPLHDELLYDNLASCQCPAAAQHGQSDVEKEAGR